MEDAAVRPRLVATVSASGEVRPREEVNISSQVPGQIVELRVEEGDHVEKGETLVQLDPERYRSEVQRLEAQLRMAQVDVDKEDVSLRTAESNLRRVKALYDQKIVSDDALDQARLSVDSGRITLQSRQEQVKQVEADLARARDDLSKTTLRAPMAGLVTRVNAKVGEQVIIGTMNNPGTVILTLSDMGEVLAEVNVDETDVTSLRPGQKAEIRVVACPRCRTTYTRARWNPSETPRTGKGPSPASPSRSGSRTPTTGSVPGCRRMPRSRSTSERTSSPSRFRPSSEER